MNRKNKVYSGCQKMARCASLFSTTGYVSLLYFGILFWKAIYRYSDKNYSKPWQVGLDSL
jgi:hypothetical protein